MVGNRQIFENHYRHTDQDEVWAPTDHQLWRDGAEYVNRTTPTLFVLLIAAFITFYTVFLRDIVAERFYGFTYSMSADDIEIDEELPNYFDALKTSHIHEIIKGYSQIKTLFGFEIEDFRTIQRLDLATVKHDADRRI